ncbi:Long-chain-fatty-acid--CoA ligase [compost metagenome]
MERLFTHSNVIAYLDHWAEVTPDRKAIVFPKRLRLDQKLRPDGGIDDETVTYGELSHRVNRLAASLAARGLQAGDRVVVMIPMSLELYTLLLALLKMAVIIVFIDPWVGLPQIKRCIALTEPKAFAGIPMIQLLGRLSGVLAPIPLRLTARGRAMFGEVQLERLLDEEHPPVATQEVAPETTALVTFTTGSTGTPKGANRTHGFLMAQHHALSREMGLRPGDVDLTTLPIFVLNNLAAGVTSVLPKMTSAKPSEVDPRVIVRQIQDHGITTAVGSPAYWKPIADYCQQTGQPLTTLRTLFTGGGPVPPGLLETLRPLMPNGEAYIGYGSTEAEPVAMISATEVCEETGALTREGQGNCVGKPAHGIALKVIRIVEGPIEVGPEGLGALELPAGGVGELVVTGDHVGKDYYRNPEAVRENKIRDADGTIWHRLGDVGYLDPSGRIWLVGRVNNLIPHGGRTLYPIQAEAIVHQLPFVGKAALLSHAGQLVLAITPTNWGSGKQRRLWEEALHEHMTLNGMPLDQVVFVRKMPVDPRHNVKIDYAKLRRRLKL